MAKQLVRVIDAAETVGIEPTDLYRLIDSGRVPGYRLDDRVCVDIDDVRSAVRDVAHRPSPA